MVCCWGGCCIICCCVIIGCELDGILVIELFVWSCFWFLEFDIFLVVVLGIFLFLFVSVGCLVNGLFCCNYLLIEKLVISVKIVVSNNLNEKVKCL